MKKAVLINAVDLENWGWEENPENGKEYDLDDIPVMYGYDFYDNFISVEHFIDTWKDEESEEGHGEWLVMDAEEVPHG